MVGVVFKNPVMQSVREVSIEEVRNEIDDIAATAARLKTAGVDCVEVHFAHGTVNYLASFISPYGNRRTDEYGGSWENRLRLPIEVIKKIREAVGEDYPILVRISADEFLGDLGITLKDTTDTIVPALDEAGVDCFDVSFGVQLENVDNLPSMYYPRGYFIYLAEAVKKVTRKPVIGVGRILDLAMAERFLEQGKADIIHIGRQLVADPETPKKYFEGRHEDIRRCVGDLHGFIDCVTCCTVNPTPPVMEGTDAVTPAGKSKKVIVIGGGVAGMEAARVCALRGHKVTLMEKEPELGGKVFALSNQSVTSEFGNVVDFLSAQMRRREVDVRVCKEATVEDVIGLSPDVVIIATGSSMVIPEVAKGKPGVMDHIEALRRKRDIGNKVVIAGLVAGELAISLAKEGKDVTIFGRGDVDTLCKYASPIMRFWLLRMLTDLNVADSLLEKLDNSPKVLYGLTTEDVTPQGVVVVDKEGEKKVLPYDTFIVSLHNERNTFLFEALQGKVPELYQVGDCAKIADIVDAIKAGNEIARKI
jgi:thioredoxin reductase